MARWFYSFFRRAVVRLVGRGLPDQAHFFMPVRTPGAAL